MIAVIGAGPAGLAAAWRAALAGHEVTVLERSDVVGGLAGSFDVAGMRVDFGSHRLHPSTAPAILAALRGLLGDDLQLRPRHGRIRLAGRWVGFPLRPSDLIRHLPPAFAAGAAIDALVAPLRSRRDDTLDGALRAGLGPTITDEFYGPYAQKLWGLPATALDAELARRRVSAGSPAAVARRVLRGARPEGRMDFYPRRGFGQISEALADAASAAGAKIRFGGAVTGLRARDGAWTVETESGPVDASTVWSTAPLPALVAMLDPAPPPEVLKAARRLEHRAMVLAYLVLDQAGWTEFDAHYFPAADIAASRVSEPRRFRSSADDPPDRTVLCAELPCAVGDDTWTATAEDLGASVVDDLARQGLPIVEPVVTEVRRVPRVYPVYRRGFAWDQSAVELWATAEHPGLIGLGRGATFTADNTHHSMAMGWAAAASLDDRGAIDPARWARARASARRFVVED